MKEFIILNRNKIPFGLKWSSIIFVAIVLVIFTWGWFRDGQVPTLKLFIAVLIFAGILFPIFIMTLGILQGLLKYRRTDKIFNTYPYNELINRNKFQRVLTNQKSKWMFSQVMLHGYYNNYPIDCEVENGIFKIIALVNSDNFEKEHLEKLKKDFGKDKVQYDWFGIALLYNVQKERLISYGQLKNDLDRFIHFFKKAELKPWDEPWAE